MNTDIETISTGTVTESGAVDAAPDALANVLSGFAEIAVKASFRHELVEVQGATEQRAYKPGKRYIRLEIPCEDDQSIEDLGFDLLRKLSLSALDIESLSVPFGDVVLLRVDEKTKPEDAIRQAEKLQQMLTHKNKVVVYGGGVNLTTLGRLAPEDKSLRLSADEMYRVKEKADDAFVDLVQVGRELYRAQRTGIAAAELTDDELLLKFVFFPDKCLVIDLVDGLIVGVYPRPSAAGQSMLTVPIATSDAG